MGSDAASLVRSGLEAIATRITTGRGAAHAVGLTHRLLTETWVARGEMSHALHFAINAPTPGDSKGTLDDAFARTLDLLGRLEKVKVTPECGTGFRMEEGEVAGIVDNFVGVRRFATGVASGTLAMQSGGDRAPADEAITSGFGAFEAAVSKAVETLLRVSGTKKKRNISERSQGSAHAKANHALRWGQAWASLQAVLRVMCMVIEVLRGNLTPAQAREARGKVADAIASRMSSARDVYALVKANSIVGRRVIDGAARDIELHRGCKTLAGGDLGAALVGGFNISGMIGKAQKAVASAAQKANAFVKNAGDAAQKATKGAGDLLDKVTDDVTKLADAGTKLADAGSKLSDSVGAASKNIGGVIKTVETGGLAGGSAGPSAHDLHAAFADVGAHAGTALSGGHVAGMQATYEALHGGRADIIKSITGALPTDGSSRAAALKMLTGAAGATMRRMDGKTDLAGGGVVATALVGGALAAAARGEFAPVTTALAGGGAPPAPLEGLGEARFRGVGAVDEAMAEWVMGMTAGLEGHLASFKAMLTVGGDSAGEGIAPDLMAETVCFIAALGVLVYICRGNKWYWPTLGDEAPEAPVGGGGEGGSDGDGDSS